MQISMSQNYFYLYYYHYATNYKSAV